MNRRFPALAAVAAAAVSMYVSGCASAEMTSAKMALQRKEFDKAKTNLETEVARNPANDEAWSLLAQTYLNLGDYGNAARAINEAVKSAKTDKVRTNYINQRNSIWVSSFNGAISAYSAYASTRSQDSLARAARLIETASSLRPDVPSTHNIVARIALEQGDTVKAMNELNEVVRLQASALELAGQKGISLGMKRADAVRALGTPSNSKGYGGQDTTVMDVFSVDGREVYLFSQADKGSSDLKTIGWRVNPPSGWTQAEKEQSEYIDDRPYLTLYELQARRRDFTNALATLDRILVLDPNNQDARGQRLNVLQSSGRLEEARSLVESLVKSNPANKMYRFDYAQFLMREKKLAEAITQYEEALRIDPNYDLALFNSAVAYKNRAAELQTAERSRASSEKGYKENEAAYMPLLTKSAEYFERYRQTPGKGEDFVVLRELGNIYAVTKDKTRTAQLTMELEALESRFAGSADYYQTMGTLYTHQNQVEKAKAAFAKEDELRKR